MYICSICGDDFKPKRSDQKICKSDSCKKEQQRLWRLKNKPKKRRKRCPYCKTLFFPFHKRQVSCGDAECKRAHKNITRLKEDREFFCAICKEKTWSSIPHAVLCGKLSCRKKYVYNFNKKNKYKEKYRKNVAKTAKNKGPFKEWETEEIIRLRLLGKTNGFIAKKLKRLLPSIEKKIVSIFKDERFASKIDDISFQIETEKNIPSKKIKRDINKWNTEIKNYFIENGFYSYTG